MMKFECKKCKEDVGNNVVRVWINELILSGKTYINSDGTEAVYQDEWEMKELNKCKCV